MNPVVVEMARRLAPVLAADQRVRFAYLFGSVARGAQGPGSDIDIAVRVEPRGSLLDDAALADALTTAAGGPEVDLLVLDGAPLWLRFRVVGGIVLFSRDERARVRDREQTEREFLDFQPYHDEYLRLTRERARRGVLSG